MPSLDEDVIPGFMSPESKQAFRHLILDQQVGLADDSLIGSAEPSAGPNRALPSILIWDITAVQRLLGEGIPNGGYANWS
jgi:hypothetical protein